MWGVGRVASAMLAVSDASIALACTKKGGYPKWVTSLSYSSSNLLLESVPCTELKLVGVTTQVRYTRVRVHGIFVIIRRCVEARSG